MSVSRNLTEDYGSSCRTARHFRRFLMQHVCPLSAVTLTAEERSREPLLTGGKDRL